MLNFGDSIGFGYGASIPAHNYVGLLISAGFSVTQLAVDGNMSCDLGGVMYANAPDTTHGNIIQVGTNDSIVNGQPGIPVFLDALGALAVWETCAISKPQTTPGFSFTGTWSGNTYWSGVPGKYTTTVGSTMAKTLSGKAIYVGSMNENNLTGGFSIYVDGAKHGPYTCASPSSTVSNGNLGVTTAKGQTFAPKLIRIGGLAPVAHSVVVNFDDNSGANPACYVDFMAGSDDAGIVPLYVMDIPPQKTNYQYGSPGVVAAYNAATAGLIAQLWTDGLNIQFCQTHDAMNISTDFYTGTLNGDDLHPNDAGYAKMFKSLLRLIHG